MSVAERPFAGKVDFDPKDPELADKMQRVEELARKNGSNAIRLTYPGIATVIYGTNHDIRYESGEQPPVARLSLEPESV